MILMNIPSVNLLIFAYKIVKFVVSVGISLLFVGCIYLRKFTYIRKQGGCTAAPRSAGERLPKLKGLRI